MDHIRNSCILAHIDRGKSTLADGLIHRCGARPRSRRDVPGTYLGVRPATLDTPPQTELVRLPGGEAVRPLATNAALRAKVEALTRKRVEYTKLDIGGGVQVDSWRILPPDFDPAKK